ncbi:MAG TPA: sulfur carrier protein ThiS [Acidimicrobiales bacterium]|nr:sulfur carrier protein ThiS [Acidimicrobiales bacterium]
MTVTVRVNGEETPLDDGATVADLVAALGLEPRGIAVAVAGEVVTRRTWGERGLVAGEVVEVLQVAQGG